MNPRRWLAWLATSSAAAQRGLASNLLPLRMAAVAVAALVLAYAGGLGWPASPWSWASMPAGLAVACSLRFGWGLLPPALLGLAVAMQGASFGTPAVLSALLAVMLFAVAAARALRALRFDLRMERGRDAGSLVLALAAAALATAALASAFVAQAQSALWWPTFVIGAIGTLLGALVASVPVLALDRRVLHTLQPTPRWSSRLLALLAAVAAPAALALAISAPTALQLAALLALPLVVAGLALRSHFTLASFTLLLGTGAGAWLARSMAGAEYDTQELALLALWTAAAVTALLGAHAAEVHWAGQRRRLEWALDGSHLGVAEWPIGGGPAFASTAWRTMTQHEARRWQPQAWLDRVHPEDRAALEEAIEALSTGSAGRRQVPLRMAHDPRHRAQHEAGRWLEATLLVIERDRAEHPTRLLATLADIHERHEIEQRQQMALSLFQHLHEGLLVADAEMKVVDVNAAYAQIVGSTREELLGTVPALLTPDPADPQARAQRVAMWTALREQGRWRGELRERLKTGAVLTLQTTISVVEGDGHIPRHHVVVIADVTEHREQRDQLERQAHTDELTRLPNRARLSQLLLDAMACTDRDGYLLAVCYLDVDHFKPVNDRFGHAAGDRLLVEMAGRLRSTLRRREDFTDAAARLGGDEFVLLLRAGTIEEARLAVERVLRVVAQPYLIDPDSAPVQVSASMGATIYPIDRSDAETLLRHADHAMYGAKQAGRNGYLFFDPEHRRRAEERVMAIGRVQEALDLAEFLLFYQPKVDMQTGRVLGLEALLRWDHPQQGLIAPLQFLPLIENTGLISRVGDWALAQALQHLAQWQEAGLEISVSVNVSARHLQEPDFVLRLAELLARHPELPPRKLEIEILESAAHADIDATSALMARCRGLGVRFALDDFGTGYSTLTYLKRLPVDALKIDRSFVAHMLDDAHDRAIVEGVVGLARTFGCTVVAEGVESPAQARALLEMGCGIGQGSGIAQPMRAEEVAAWVREYRGMFALAPAVLGDSARPASA